MYCTEEGDGVAVPRHNAIRHGVKYTRGVGGETQKSRPPLTYFTIIIIIVIIIEIINVQVPQTHDLLAGP